MCEWLIKGIKFWLKILQCYGGRSNSRNNWSEKNSRFMGFKKTLNLRDCRVIICL